MEAAAQPLLGDTTASELPKLTRRRCSAPGTVGAASGLGWGVLKLSIGAIALLAVIAGGCIAAFITIYGTGSIGADRPEPRKSAGMVVIDAAPSQVHDRGSPTGAAAGFSKPTLVVWSGKGHHVNVLYNNFFRMDLSIGMWSHLHAKAAAQHNTTTPALAKNTPLLAKPSRGLKLHKGPAETGDSLGQPEPSSRPDTDDSDQQEQDGDVAEVEPSRWQRFWQQLQRHHTKPKPGMPLPRWKEVTAYLPEREELVVFGGDAMDIGKPGAIKKQHYLNDMWRTHPKSKQPIWEPVTALGNSSSDAASQPLPRRAHSGCLLPERNGSNSLLIYGGRDEHRRLLRDVWAAKLMNTGVIWSQLYFPPRKWHPNAEPGPRKGHVAVMLPGKTRRMLIFGGRNDSAVAYYTDMWAFDVDKQQWEQLGPPRGIAPPARDHFGAFYHHGKVVIYGGRGGADYSSSQPLGDMWEYDVASNSWREVTPEPGPYPLPRFLYSSDSYTVANATSDEVDTRFVVFGGEARHVCYLNDVWEYSQLANRWSQLSPVDWKQAHCSRLKPTEGPSGASQAEARIQELGARLGDFW